ncbi:MAG: hypothetical protein HY720_30485 [Planctomycetes bacterium]|nr:hypothetical protein [Planctomycetota bacterium]
MTRPVLSARARLSSAEENLRRTLDWVTRFDNKAAIVLGAATGMLGILATFAPPYAAWNVAMAAFAAPAIAALAVSLVFAYLGTYPRTAGPSRSLLYFGSIAARPYEEFRREFAGRDVALFLDDLLEQCHTNSQILAEKFARLRRAYVALFAAIVPWAVTIFLFRSQG